MNGNVPEDTAKWTKVEAGDRPLAYDVRVYPSGILYENDGSKDNDIKSGEPLTTWISSDGGKTYTKYVDNVKTTVTKTAAQMERNVVGILLNLNTPFDATFLMYDNLGVYVGQSAVSVDSAKTRTPNFVDRSGKYRVLVAFNGRRNAAPISSGVYVLRMITFRDEISSTGERRKRLLENRVFKLGYKGNPE
jgi:hypothetical protein